MIAYKLSLAPFLHLVICYEAFRKNKFWKIQGKEI